MPRGRRAAGTACARRAALGASARRVCVCEDTGRRVDRAVLRKEHGCWSGTPVVAWSNRPLVCHLESCAQILEQHSLMVGDVVITVCLENCRTNWTNTIGGRCFDRFRSRPLSWIPTLENQRKLQTNTLRYCKSIGSRHFLSNLLVLVPCVCVSFGCDPSNLVLVLWVCGCSHRRSRRNFTRSMGVDGLQSQWKRGYTSGYARKEELFGKCCGHCKSGRAHVVQKR